jgi:versiconal hemiacetal acetate esterase
MAAPSTGGYAPEWLEVSFCTLRDAFRSTDDPQYEKALGGGRVCLHGSAADIEEQFQGLGAMIAAQSPPPDATVDTRDETADGVPVRIYNPQGHTGKKLPIGVYFHGGGYVVGNLDSEDAWCRYFAKNIPCVIVSVDYRLGPKFKLPVMLDDSSAATQWVWSSSIRRI